MEIPMVGSAIQIHSYKHNGEIHRIWKDNVVLKSTANIIIGANDKTEVIDSNGGVWVTREPAIVYFHAKYWFNVIGMLRKDGIHFYSNISSPFLYENETLKYIDYDLDVKVYPDMTYTLLDEDEYALHKKVMNYPLELDHILKNNLEYLLTLIRQGKGPFAPGFIDEWYDISLTYMG